MLIFRSLSRIGEDRDVDLPTEIRVLSALPGSPASHLIETSTVRTNRFAEEMTPDAARVSSVDCLESTRDVARKLTVAHLVLGWGVGGDRDMLMIM